MTTAQMKAQRPELYALWEKLERHKWDSNWWRFCFTLRSYLAFERRVKNNYPHYLMRAFADMWWEIGAEHYPIKPQHDMNN